MNRKTVLALVVMQVTLAVGTSPLFACGCTEVWGVGSAITAPTITIPTAANNSCGINAEVNFTCSQSTDADYHRLTDCSVEYPQDTLTYTWTKTGGYWKNGVSTGRTVTWIAPPNPGIYTVRATVTDTGAHGTDNDANSPYAERTMQVIRLDKVRLYLYHYGTAYPYISSDAFKTRAVVWAACGTQGAYCDLVFDESLAWGLIQVSKVRLMTPTPKSRRTLRSSATPWMTGPTTGRA